MSIGCRRAAAALLAAAILLGAPASAAAGPVPQLSSTEGTETEIPCEGDTCQPLPTPPEDPQPGTTVVGPANPPPHYAKPPRKPRHHKRHHRRRGGKG